MNTFNIEEDTNADDALTDVSENATITTTTNENTNVATTATTITTANETLSENNAELNDGLSTTSLRNREITRNRVVNPYATPSPIVNVEEEREKQKKFQIK